LTQIKRHGVTHLDPLLEATNLPDLLGLRSVGRYTAANVRRVLPRIQRGQLLEMLDLVQVGDVSRAKLALTPHVPPLRLPLRAKPALTPRERRLRPPCRAKLAFTTRERRLRPPVKSPSLRRVC
jgi:hypothetical protein